MNTVNVNLKVRTFTQFLDPKVTGFSEKLGFHSFHVDQKNYARLEVLQLFMEMTWKAAVSRNYFSFSS